VCAFSSIAELVVALNNEYDANLEDGLEDNMPLVKYNPDSFEVQLWEGAAGCMDIKNKNKYYS
jgi:hypothetical protein